MDRAESALFTQLTVNTPTVLAVRSVDAMHKTLHGNVGRGAPPAFPPANLCMIGNPRHAQ
jgi:hypothetical protein